MRKLTGALGAFIFLALAACGGSGGGNKTPPPDNESPPTGGIGRTGIAVGPISTFGSVVVNGVRYDTTSATITVDDSPGTEDDLKVGDIVTVSGTIDDDGTTGTAEEVSFDDVVKGPVQGVDTAANSLVVLSQTVFVTPDTSFDDSLIPATLDGVSVGQIVEISGQFNADGDIVATRIEPKPAGTQFEVHGTVSALDTMNQQFNLRNLVVDYSAAALDNFPGGQISEGDFVEAKGTNLGAGDELLATRVEFENLVPDLADGLHVEVEGFITNFNSAEDFMVAGFNVTTNGSTVFEGGVSGDLGPNIKVEVEGDINASDILVATKVDIRRAKAVRATAVIDSADGANDSIVLLGITVNVDTLTRIEDKSDADINPLSVSNLAAGDYVEVRGDEFPAGSGNILASILEREDPDTETLLQGFVETAGNPSFTILGVTIETSGATVFRDVNDAVIPAVDFFDQLAAGNLVKASGTEAADMVISAAEVEFELEL